MTMFDFVRLARSLMDQWGLRGWRVSFDGAKRRVGVCRYSKKELGFSLHFIGRNTEARVRDTVLHEIAHALAGPKTGHGPAFMLCCRIVGAQERRCYSTTDTDMPKGRWRAMCRKCRRTFDKHRRPKGRRYCVQCGPTDGALEWHDIGHALEAAERMQRQGDSAE